ncbi:uncharacterized protein LOC131054595 [Cryptomeria japonica]|uniref:uncharacterized protein LOC131054595 n=1 Tax=Cryptomeria japonica TaxID=3369 RepID=UPI0027DA90B0|nr:uncharacterized protein LOC131054595 [Cryptomeria japonica]
MNGGLESILNFKPSTSVKNEVGFPQPIPQKANEKYSPVPMANYANPFFDQAPLIQPPLSVATKLPWLPQTGPVIVEPFFQKRTSLPISTNLSGSSSDHTPLIQFPSSAAKDFPLFPQTESVIAEPIFENPTSLSISTNLSGSSSCIHNENTTFQGNFDKLELAYQAPDEKCTQHIAFKEMQSYAYNMKATSFERRKHRIKVRRDCRSKERRPYQVFEKRCSKYKNKRLYSSILAHLHPTNTKDETKTQLSNEGLRLLLQKQLENSDVSNLGRIVLPKKAAEANLPRLEMKEGIVISAKDHDNDRSWILKYRFWPNNKTRMYILENTGAFIREHGLQKGDLLMLYEDEDRYVIRGIKATESKESNSSSCKNEPKLESSEDGGDQIPVGDSVLASQGIENTSIPETTHEMNQSILSIKGEEANIMAHEPEVPLIANMPLEESDESKVPLISHTPFEESDESEVPLIVNPRFEEREIFSSLEDLRGMYLFKATDWRAS